MPILAEKNLSIPTSCFIRQFIPVTQYVGLDKLHCRTVYGYLTFKVYFKIILNVKIAKLKDSKERFKMADI